ncbi:MAG: hypothetical protein A2287_09640 [Candidatus Melainabacteria bacterium RIFOXYA12_FULL_32_12]|nr:MAG: hypothetical protein A2255_02860 [Candidatus Melainabacteria bacterium RIFOXYA2_FULL_32_9]OGI25748.1 MAG: hypothetical protein A2287_09640 [Candidatus Melainabacteria bacterium RIFOXYA12_FULL_32_12]
MNVQDSMTNIVNSTAKVNAEKSQERVGQSTMDQDSFLQLLMMQLKYQDPLNPMGNTEFISQQAQFTQISEIQKLNKNMSNVANTNEIMQASSLIGKEVTITDPENSKNTITGAVTEAKISDKGTNIVINNTEYPINSIRSIK